MYRKLHAIILFVPFLITSLLFFSCEEKEYHSNYLLPEAIETENTKVIIDDELTPYYTIITNEYHLLVSARKIEEVVIVDGWMKNVAANEYKLESTRFYATDSQSILLEALEPEEAVNLIHGFQVSQESIPHPYLEESQNLIVTSSGSGYKIYSSPDVYTRLTNEAIYLINKSQARKAAQSSLSRAQMLQDIELTIVKDSTIPSETIKYFQIFYIAPDNAYPLDFFVKEKETLINVSFNQPKRMAYFSTTNFAMYDIYMEGKRPLTTTSWDSREESRGEKAEFNVKDVIIESLNQLKQFELIVYNYGSDIHRQVRIAGDLEDKENVKKLSSFMEADYLFNPNVSRTEKGSYLFTLDIYDLTTGEAVFRASRTPNDIDITTIISEEIVLLLYNEIYNELKMGIINNYGKL